MQSILFYSFSFLALLSAALVVILPRPTRALLCLALTMFSLSVLYLLLGAPFIAMVNIIVYAGAVLVLFLFVIMLQGIGAQDLPLSKRFQKGYIFLSCFTALSFLTAVLFFFQNAIFWSPRQIDGSTERIGMALFQNYLLPFELTSLLLILGVFAAVALAKKDQDAS